MAKKAATKKASVKRSFARPKLDKRRVTLAHITAVTEAMAEGKEPPTLQQVELAELTRRKPKPPPPVVREDGSIVPFQTEIPGRLFGPDDPLYHWENHWLQTKVAYKGGGEGPFKMRGIQILIVQEVNRCMKEGRGARILVVKVRQPGASTGVAHMAVGAMAANHMYRVGAVSFGLDGIAPIRKRYRQAVKSHPSFAPDARGRFQNSRLQFGDEGWESSINESGVIFGGARAGRGGALEDPKEMLSNLFRGESMAGLHVSEADYWDDFAAAMEACVAGVSSKGWLIVETTLARGRNNTGFRKFIDNILRDIAEGKRTPWTIIGWWLPDDENCRAGAADDPGMGIPWNEKIEREVQETLTPSEALLVQRMLAEGKPRPLAAVEFLRFKEKEVGPGASSAYPIDLKSALVYASDYFVPRKAVERLKLEAKQNPLRYCVGLSVDENLRWSVAPAPKESEKSKVLRCWRAPESGLVYRAMLDVGDAKQGYEGRCRSDLNIIACTGPDRGTVVARWSGKTPASYAADMLHAGAQYYGGCTGGITFDRGGVGTGVEVRLKQLGTEYVDRMEGGKMGVLVPNSHERLGMLENMRRIIEEGRLRIYDDDTMLNDEGLIWQLEHFMADKGYTGIKDGVASLYTGLWKIPASTIATWDTWDERQAGYDAGLTDPVVLAARERQNQDAEEERARALARIDAEREMQEYMFPVN